MLGTIIHPSEVVFTSSSHCPLRCGSVARELTKCYGSGFYEKKLFTIWQCPSCGIGFTDPIPTADSAHLLYETRESGDFQPNDSSLVSALKAIAARRDVRKFCRDADKTGKFLDFGCGNGAFVRAIQQVFPNAHAVGSDLHQSPPPFLNDTNYIHNKHLPKGEFDFILCRHVLEHTYEPTEFLSYLKTLLRPGGVLAIEVPSLTAALRHLFGKRWDSYYAPYHPLQFTPQSLAKVVENAGMTVIRQDRAEMPKMGRNLRNVFGGEYGMAYFVAGMALQPLQVAVGKITGTSVCLRIFARA